NNGELKTLQTELSGTLARSSNDEYWLDFPVFLTGTASWLEVVSSGIPWLHDGYDTKTGSKRGILVPTLIKMLALEDEKKPYKRTWEELHNAAQQLVGELLMGGNANPEKYTKLEEWTLRARQYTHAMYKFNMIDDILVQLARTAQLGTDGTVVEPGHKTQILQPGNPKKPEGMDIPPEKSKIQPTDKPGSGEIRFNKPFYIRHLKILQRWRLPRALGMFILAGGWLMVQTACQAFPRLKISGTDRDLDPDANKELNLMKLRHGMPGVRFRPLSTKQWWNVWGMITGLYRENEQTPATIYAYPPWLRLIQEPELQGSGSLESGLAGWRYTLTRRLLDNLLAYHRVDYLYSGTGFWERNLDKLFRRNISAPSKDTLTRRKIPGFRTRLARWAAVKLPWSAGFRKSLRLSILKAYPDWEIEKILKGIKAEYPKDMTPSCLDSLAVQFNRPESMLYQAYWGMVRALPEKFTPQQTEFFRQLRKSMLPNQTDVPERMPDNIAVYLELISCLDIGPSFEIGRWSVHDYVPGYLKGTAISLPISLKNSAGVRELRVIISMLRGFQPWIILNNRTMEEIIYPRRTPHIFEQAA
ncbi:hypothetical protein KAR10_08765, partial [bacterium]|nr:hypothetical protein [bacterium]